MPRTVWLCHLLIGMLIGGAIARCGAANAAEVGMVAYFNATSCPENWGAVTAPGRFLVATGTLGSDTYTLAATGGEARHTLTTAEMPQHVHPLPLNNSTGTGGQPGIRTAGGANSIQVFSGTSANLAIIANSTQGGGGAHENRPPYLALLLCERTLEDETAMGFWPELSMADAMDIAGACLLLFALAWGLSVVVRFTINQR